MLSYIKNILSGEPVDAQTSTLNISTEKKLQVATCSLFVELANTDDEFAEEEKKLIYNLMQKQFDLNEDELSELLELAGDKIKRNVSLYEYTGIINKNFSRDEKYQVLKQLWKLVFIDGKLDAHEEYFLRKVSGNLHMDHKDMIAAKLEVKRELDI